MSISHQMRLRTCLSGSPNPSIGVAVLGDAQSAWGMARFTSGWAP